MDIYILKKRAINSDTSDYSQNKKYKPEIKTSKTEQDWTQLYVKFATQKTGNIQDDIKSKENAIKAIQDDKITPRDLYYRRMMCLLLQLNILYINEPDTYYKRIQYLIDKLKELINSYENKTELPISIDTLNLLKKTQAHFSATQQANNTPVTLQELKGVIALESNPTTEVMKKIHRHYQAFTTSSNNLEQPIDKKTYENLAKLCQKIPENKRTIEDWTLLYVALSKQKTSDEESNFDIIKTCFKETKKDTVTPKSTVDRRTSAINKQLHPLVNKYLAKIKIEEQKQKELNLRASLGEIMKLRATNPTGP